MTKQWTRTAPLQGVPEKVTMETWTYGDLVCPVEVTIGKPLDVRGLKNTSLEEIKEYSAFLKKTAEEMYDTGAQRFVENCPSCGETNGSCLYVIMVFKQPYARCSFCGHGFVRWQAPPLASDSDEHAAPYVDRASLEVRMKQVIEPKVDWTLRQYKRLYNKPIYQSCDVGAGGGHFVAAMRKHCAMTLGYESNRASRAFAEEAFSLSLRDGDFLDMDGYGSDFDLVTMWGLLEYVSEPRKFLTGARDALRSDGMLIVEIPRLDCFGTAVQREMPEYVARHMDPTSHMNAFTEASICTALVETGFKPVAAWYFGMDMYELLTQMAIRCGGQKHTTLVDYFADLIPALQASLDRGRECDDIVIAAVPL